MTIIANSYRQLNLWPQWSPLLESGVTRWGEHGGKTIWEPQWSPLLESGVTTRSQSQSGMWLRRNGARS